MSCYATFGLEACLAYEFLAPFNKKGEWGILMEEKCSTYWAYQKKGSTVHDISQHKEFTYHFLKQSKHNNFNTYFFVRKTLLENYD